MNVQHLITKQMDSSNTRRYFFLNHEAYGARLKNPFHRRRTVKLYLYIADTRYEFTYAYEPGRSQPYFYVDVPDNRLCNRIECCLLNGKGRDIPPLRSVPVSSEFENLHEKLLTILPDDHAA